MFKFWVFVRVIVQNDNDEVLLFQESEYNIGIVEDVVINKLLVVIVVRDVDGDNLSYFIISGDGGNIFNINLLIGVLLFRQSVRGK